MKIVIFQTHHPGASRHPSWPGGAIARICQVYYCPNLGGQFVHPHFKLVPLPGQNAFHFTGIATTNR
jgi:hypothetical protein